MAENPGSKEAVETDRVAKSETMSNDNLSDITRIKLWLHLLAGACLVDVLRELPQYRRTRPGNVHTIGPNPLSYPNRTSSATPGDRRELVQLPG